jgi:hypothetical protein
MRRLVVAAVMVTLSCAGTASSQSSGDPDAKTLLAKARAAMGFAAAGSGVLHFHVTIADQQNYQSDRTYPPFFDAFVDGEQWLAADTAVLRITSSLTYPGGNAFPSTALYAADRAAMLRNEQPVPLPQSQLRMRDLNAWAVIADWSAATDVRREARDETYRDYPRAVLTRTARGTQHRLLIDSKTGFPVKLEFVEPHYLWGQQRIEYVFSNWTAFGSLITNATSFRVADGQTEMSATFSRMELMDRAAAPALELAATGPAPDNPLFLQPSAPTVSHVGPRTLLLTNPGYTEAAALAGDEVFVFDATQAEQRAALDAEAIDKAFGAGHRINVIVTDLAWPHVAGVRYWVSRGATIIAHTAARPFLQRIVDREWTLHPDALEKKRQPLKFVGVDKTQSLASGAIALTPIDGAGSEVALIAYVPGDRFVWASDYIQTVSEPTVYTSEVFAAVTRAGWQPERTAAQHLPLTPWPTIAALQKR